MIWKIVPCNEDLTNFQLNVPYLRYNTALRTMEIRHYGPVCEVSETGLYSCILDPEGDIGSPMFIITRYYIQGARSKFLGGGRVGGLGIYHPPYHHPPFDFKGKISHFCHPTLLKIRFKITVTPPLKNGQSQNYGTSINSNGLLTL